MAEIDANGLWVLDVSGDVDLRFGGFGNELHVELEFLEAIDD